MSDKKSGQTSEEIIVVPLETNVMQKGFFYSFARRNIIEGLAIAGAVCYGISYIDFTTPVMLWHMGVFGIGIFFFVARGYKNRSFLQAAHDYIHTLRTRKQLHLRGPEYVRQDIKIQEGEGADESIAKRFIGRTNKRLDKFIERYGEEEAGEEDT